MYKHQTVLKKEVIENLQLSPDGIYVDCTLGGGGHSEEIASRLTGTGHLYAFDQDRKAIKAASERLQPYKDQVTLVHRNFREFTRYLHEHGTMSVDGILFDLGVSSPQLDESSRGFSYQHDAPLDMRMNQDAEITAYDIVNQWDVHELISIFFRYGEEKFSKSVARNIEKHRKKKPIKTTLELVTTIKEAIPASTRRKGSHPAKRIFQAIRIAVNDELQAFEETLSETLIMVKPGGRICVITFHSLEDRICQAIFKKASQPPPLPRGLPVIPEEFKPDFTIITKKPIVPTVKEQSDNRRSRSARLRVLEKNHDITRRRHTDE